jgi:hypothetical protein
MEKMRLSDAQDPALLELFELFALLQQYTRILTP